MLVAPMWPLLVQIYGLLENTFYTQPPKILRIIKPLKGIEAMRVSFKGLCVGNILKMLTFLKTF